MTRVEEIENAVAELPKEQLARFRQWFAEFEARVWDQESKRTSRPAGWTGSPRKLSATVSVSVSRA